MLQIIIQLTKNVKVRGRIGMFLSVIDQATGLMDNVTEQEADPCHLMGPCRWWPQYHGCSREVQSPTLLV